MGIQRQHPQGWFYEFHEATNEFMEIFGLADEVELRYNGDTIASPIIWAGDRSNKDTKEAHLSDVISRLKLDYNSDKLFSLEGRQELANLLGTSIRFSWGKMDLYDGPIAYDRGTFSPLE